MRLNSVLNACSLVWAESEGVAETGVREPPPTEAGPCDSWGGPTEREKSSDAMGTGLSRLEDKERSGNWERGASKSGLRQG